MSRDTNKIDSIAVDCVSQEVNRHELLHPDIKKDKMPFFDGHIWVYKNPKQKNENYNDRISVQVKGREVAAFKRKTCVFRPVERTELEAYRKESGIIFFVVEILKDKDDTKVFWKQLLPYEIDSILKKFSTKQKTTSIELRSLAGHDLTLLCQNFIVNRDKQKHGKVRTICEIEGLEGFSISAITDLGRKGNNALNDFILAKNPLYLYADVANNMSFPIADITNDNVFLMLRMNDEVWVDDKSFGTEYYSLQMNKDGSYVQFGLSWCFLPNGKAKFSAVGSLEEKIRDVDFLLRVIKGGKIRIGDFEFPYTPHLPPDQKISIRELEQKLEFLQIIKRVFDFLGVNSPVDITAFTEKDFQRIFALAEYVIHGKDCPLTFKNKGINVLGIGKYRFVVLAFHKKIVSLFTPNYREWIRGSLERNDGAHFDISPYHFLNTEVIAKSSNWNPIVVMESIRALPFSEPAGSQYTNLLLEAIKAIDLETKNDGVVQFACDLSDYLCENEDSVIYRLNKLQIKKRLGELATSDKDWLVAERDKQDDPTILCGIAILLEDRDQFDEQFAKLTRKQQDEFRKYPIMKLLKPEVLAKKMESKRKPEKTENKRKRFRAATK